MLRGLLQISVAKITTIYFTALWPWYSCQSIACAPCLKKVYMRACFSAYFWFVVYVKHCEENFLLDATVNFINIF